MLTAKEAKIRTDKRVAEMLETSYASALELIHENITDATQSGKTYTICDGLHYGRYGRNLGFYDVAMMNRICELLVGLGYNTKLESVTKYNGELPLEHFKLLISWDVAV